ncbi:transmembrane protein 154 isoform X1 [Sinocyclocheilus rhinocerous]|uniref:transmembrane protein 154 isoform X1 n=1 Tax=Sinocyclocheilus rhinocerous TaxID=307959 RepID=UPI0007B794F0|nr:PREDICTED: transmembrane protein 154-like isoform X1 [Sinocyclocheilus rhinocerous]
MILILFLLLALTASWTGLVQCEDNEETEQEIALKDSHLTVLLTDEAVGEEENSENQGDGAGSGDGRSQDLDSQPNSESNTDQTVKNEETKPTTEANTDADTEDLNPVMIIIPLVLTLVFIAVIVCVAMIYRRWRIKVAEDTKEDPYLDHEDHEKVPMPMFEDDIPSVMELEMEDLENWMAKDGGKKVDTGQI